MENQVGKIEEVPEYLYQYTSISNLALILATRKIKFNSLKNVDDLEEAQAGDSDDFGKFAFVSCWTDDENENIALWSMYTPKASGVRIKLPYNCLIDDYEFAAKQLKECGLNPMHIYSFMSSYEIEKVKYTDNTKELYPDIFDDVMGVCLNKLGVNKRLNWKFENEWRYIIYSDLKNWWNKDEPMEVGKKRLNDFDNIPEGIFMKISDEAYKHMEIMLGPTITKADEIIVESLIEKYNKTANVKRSSLKLKSKN